MFGNTQASKVMLAARPSDGESLTVTNEFVPLNNSAYQSTLPWSKLLRVSSRVAMARGVRQVGTARSSNRMPQQDRSL